MAEVSTLKRFDSIWGVRNNGEPRVRHVIEVNLTTAKEIWKYFNKPQEWFKEKETKPYSEKTLNDKIIELCKKLMEDGEDISKYQSIVFAGSIEDKIECIKTFDDHGLNIDRLTTGENVKEKVIDSTAFKKSVLENLDKITELIKEGKIYKDMNLFKETEPEETDDE